MCFVPVYMALLVHFCSRCRMKSGGSVQGGQTGMLINPQPAGYGSVSSTEDFASRANSGYQHISGHLFVQDAVGLQPSRFPKLSRRSFYSDRNVGLINRTHSPFNLVKSLKFGHSVCTDNQASAFKKGATSRVIQ